VSPGGRFTFRLECGSVVKPLKERSVYRGEWFCHVIETSLPYVDTVTRYNGGEGICNYLWMMTIFWWMEVHTEVSYVH